MAYAFSVNNTPATGAVAVFTLLTLLVSQGWTKTQDSDGTTYSAAGTQVTSGAAGANGLGNNRAWFVLKQAGSSRAYCFQRNTADNISWRVSYCADNAFTAGAPGATQIPAPAAGSVEIILLGGGTPAAPTFTAMFNADGGYRWHCVAGASSEKYSWAAWAVTTASTTVASSLIFDGMRDGTFNASDTDPVVYDVSGSASPGFNQFTDAEGALTWLGALSAGANNRAIAARRYGFGGGTSIGTNPFTGNDDLSPVPWVRTTAPGAWKGFSTLLQWPTVARTNMDTYTDASTRDKVYVSGYALPWNGSVPTI